jgi:hypothetical protein
MGPRKSIGGLTFALGQDLYQDMAALQAETFAHHGLSFATVVEEGSSLSVALQASPSKIIRVKHRPRVPFDFEAVAFDLSPFDITIKTDADLLLPRGWQGLPDWVQHTNIVSAQPITIHGHRVRASPYRKKWTSLGLPEVHSAFFLFDRSQTSQKFFFEVKRIFSTYRDISICDVEPKASTDLVYSLAWANVKGQDLGSTLPFVHMKPGTSGFSCHYENWSPYLVYMNDAEGSYINGLQIIHPFHYYEKSFVKENHHVHLGQ